MATKWKASNFLKKIAAPATILGGPLAPALLAIRERNQQQRRSPAADFAVRREQAFAAPQTAAPPAFDTAIGGGDFEVPPAGEPFDVQALLAELLSGSGAAGGGGGGGGGFDVGTALAALGAGPDRATYLRPFDEAEARSREAATAGQGTIASTYAALREQLGQNQAGADQVAQRVAAEQAARQQQAQQQVAAANSGAQTDLAAQGGQNLVGSLMGGLQAAGGQQQANLTAQAARQQALLGEQQRNQQLSSATRVEDARLGEANSLGALQTNLNNVLNQIGIGRAGAERQYTNDAQRFETQKASIQLEAQQANARAAAASQKAASAASREARSAAKEEASEARRQAADAEKQAKAVEKAESEARAAKIAADREKFISSFPHWQRVSPKHFEYFEGLIRDPEVNRGKPEEQLQKALTLIYADAGRDFRGLIPKANPAALEEWARLYFGVPKATPAPASVGRSGGGRIYG